MPEHFYDGLRKSHQRMLMRPHNKTCGKETDEVERVCVVAQSTLPEGYSRSIWSSAIFANPLFSFLTRGRNENTTRTIRIIARFAAPQGRTSGLLRGANLAIVA